MSDDESSHHFLYCAIALPATPTSCCSLSTALVTLSSPSLRYFWVMVFFRFSFSSVLSWIEKTSGIKSQGKLTSPQGDPESCISFTAIVPREKKARKWKLQLPSSHLPRLDWLPGSRQAYFQLIKDHVSTFVTRMRRFLAKFQSVQHITIRVLISHM